MIRKSIKIKCLLCKSDRYDTLYSGPIRSGHYGMETKKFYDVIQCVNCKLTKLKDFPKIDYSSSDYRENYNNSSSVDNYIKLHDSEQSPRINRIGIEKFRNKIVLDYGCGGGSFLDAVKGVAKHTIAIEPFEGFHNSLQKRGHEVFQYAKDAKVYKGKIDVMTSFGVIEHVEDPFGMIREVHALLTKNGKLYVETDNLNEILMHFDIPEFNKFFFRTAHFWYFNEESLRYIFKKSGFKKINSGFRHGYGLSNTLLWLKNRKPAESEKIAFIDSIFDKSWNFNLEKHGLAELLHFEVEK